jgi:glycosyltransferase involved in cell wall biosynthesis
LADPPEVSVVIPTRSRWHLLSTAALPSALEQESVQVEVIVVDDGSQDETPARLA